MGRPTLSQRLAGTVHVSGSTAPPAITDDSPVNGCCFGEAMDGPTRCTCWEPIFDLEQSDALAEGPPMARAKCCHDCAYRTDSPERKDEYEAEALEDLARSQRGTFWCHAGMRRAVAYRHPSGVVVAAGDGDYRPPEFRGRAWKADGSPAEICGGWAALAGVNR